MKINNSTAIWVLSILWRYKFRFMAGILASFFAASSILLVLSQTEAIFEPLEGKQVTQREVVVERQGEKISMNIEVSKDHEKSIIAGDKILDINTPNIDTIQGGKIFEKIPNFIRELLDININNLAEEQGKIFMLLTIFFLLVGFFLKAFFSFLNSYIYQWLSLRFAHDVRRDLVNKLLYKKTAFYQKNLPTDIISRCTNDINMMAGAIPDLLSSVTKVPLELICVLGFLVYKSINSGLGNVVVFLLIFTPITVVPVLLLGKFIKKHIRQSLKNVSSLTNNMHELFSFINLVKVSNKQNAEFNQYSTTNSQFFSKLKKIARLSLLASPLMEIMSIFVLSFFLFYCYLHGVSISVVVAITLAIQFAYEPIKKLSRTHLRWVNLKQASVEVRKYFNDDDREDIHKGKELVEFNHSIELKNVSFSYATKQVIKNVNLTIKKGQFIAFVGSVGSGKTTLLSLLSRFYDIQEGEILIDGVRINEYSLKSFYKLFSFVSQTNVLFNRTLKENYVYSTEGEINEQYFNEIAKITGLDQIANDKEDKYDSLVGEGGKLLSGGQKQRLAIARALLRNTPILILDEATSAMDNITERRLKKSIDNLKSEKTIIAIAHRLSTIESADCIYVLNEGAIVEQGTHQELLSKKGAYYNMSHQNF